MTGTGVELSDLTHPKIPISGSGGAKSDASDAPTPPQNADLAAIVEARPELPGHIKGAIKALVQTHEPEDR